MTHEPRAPAGTAPLSGRLLSSRAGTQLGHLALEARNALRELAK